MSLFKRFQKQENHFSDDIFCYINAAFCTIAEKIGDSEHEAA